MRKRRRWRRKIAVGALLAYFVILFGGCTDWLILGPRPGKFDPGTARRQIININGRGLECWVSRSEALAQTDEPQAYLIEFCGNATRAEQIAQYVTWRWRHFPIEAWVMNYPGAGASEGSFRLKNITPAALGLYDELHRKGKPIFVEANSLGTTAALCVAARREVAGCVLHDPVPLKTLIMEKYGWWNLWLIAAPVAWRLPTELDSIQNARQVKAPALLILAEKDDFVLPKYQRMVTEAYRGEHRSVILPGAGHWAGVSGDAEQEVEKGLQWLWTAAPTTQPDTH